MNALLDYGSSSSADTDEESDKECDKKKAIEEENLKKPELPRLPKPTMEVNLKTSVFFNPFVTEEMAKIAILEKHVKMVPGKQDVQMINGKKICFAYRKGKCRFGHKCKYAHDSDIQKPPEELEAEKQKLTTVVCEKPGTMPTYRHAPHINKNSTVDGGILVNKTTKKRKRRGLTQGLVPGQKVFKQYKK